MTDINLEQDRRWSAWQQANTVTARQGARFARVLFGVALVAAALVALAAAL